MVRLLSPAEMNFPSATVYRVSPNTPNPDQNRSDSSSRLNGTSAAMNRDSDSTIVDDDDRANKDDKAMSPLHKDFIPGNNDVICGRGKKCYAHTGNERFRHIVLSYLDSYSAASSRPEKSEILSAVVSQVRKNSPQGGFVKQDTITGQWFEVGDFLAREKTSQAFRDALHEHYRSSKKSKHEKRRQRTRAKPQKELLSPEIPPLSEGNIHDDDPLPYSIASSPLVSRQRLTTLREEPQVHPRASSFSGNERVPVREVPQRALSLSGGRGGGRHSARPNIPDRESLYHRADSAPARSSYDHEMSMDEMASSRHDEKMDPRHQSWPRADHYEERMDYGHESWPRRYPASHHAMFNPPVAHQISPPQFHPVGPEDIAAVRSYPNTEAIMMEVENVSSGHHPEHHAPWSADDMDCESSHPPRRDSHSPQGEAFLPPTPSHAYASDNRYEIQPPHAPTHHRTDSIASATVIVAQLSSALSDTLPEDDNPFEPIPIGGKRQAQ